MRGRRIPVLLLLVLALPAWLAAETPWIAPPAEAARENPREATGDSIARGREIFLADCAPCHGEGGRGDGEMADVLPEPPQDLIRTTPSQSDGTLQWKIRTGQVPMPEYEADYSSDEIWDLVNFIRTLGTDAPGEGDRGTADTP